MEGLGRVFDVAPVIVPVDIAGGAQTGARVHIGNADGISFLVFKEKASTASDDTTLTVQEHTAYSGGTSTSLAVLDHFYQKAATAIDPDDTWSKNDSTTTSTVLLDSENESITVIEVKASDLDSGYEWVSVNATDTSTAGQYLSVVAILHGLKVQRTPANLPGLWNV